MVGGAYRVCVNVHVCVCVICRAENAQVCPLHLTLAATDGAPCELTGNTTARPYHSDY